MCCGETWRTTTSTIKKVQAFKIPAYAEYWKCTGQLPSVTQISRRKTTKFQQQKRSEEDSNGLDKPQGNH
jgi:hypothetical protein